MKDLLNLVAQQGAAELRLESDRPPMMVLRGKVRVLDGPPVTSDDINELFRGIATPEQRRELDLCGSTHFTPANDPASHFRVRADIRHNKLRMSIKNLHP